MNRQLITALVTFSGTIAFASESPDAALVRLAQRLAPVISVLVPAVEVKTNAPSTLAIVYRAQTYKIHGVSMTGEISKEAHDEVGPTFKGFVLSVQVQPKGEINQAATPQTLREPYWQTYLQLTPLAGSDKQLYWGLSFGSRTDTNLLARIRRKIEDLNEE